MCKHLCAAIDTLDDRKQWLFSCMVMSFIPPCQINYFLLIRLVVGQVCRPLQASAVTISLTASLPRTLFTDRGCEHPSEPGPNLRK